MWLKLLLSRPVSIASFHWASKMESGSNSPSVKSEVASMSTSAAAAEDVVVVSSSTPKVPAPVTTATTTTTPTTTTTVNSNVINNHHGGSIRKSTAGNATATTAAGELKGASGGTAHSGGGGGNAHATHATNSGSGSHRHGHGHGRLATSSSTTHHNNANTAATTTTTNSNNTHSSTTNKTRSSPASNAAVTAANTAANRKGLGAVSAKFRNLICTNGTERLTREFRDVKCSGMPQVRELKLCDNNLFHWKFLLLPDMAPYNKNAFQAEIKFPTSYPQMAPVITVHNIYHPNVDEKGFVCLHCLSHWSRKTKIEDVLQKLFALIRDPEPHHPMRFDVADEYLKDRKVFMHKAFEAAKSFGVPRPKF